MLLRHTFYAFFSVLFGLIILNVLLYRGAQSWLLLLIGAAMALCFLLFIHFWGPSIERMNRRRFKVLFAVCAAVAFLAGAYLVYNLREYLIIDMLEIYDSTAKLLRDGVLAERSWYFIRCKNNFAMLLLSWALHAAAQLFGIEMGTEASLNFMTAFNYLLVVFSVFLLCRLAWRLFRSRTAAVVAFLLSVCFAPFYLWSALFYTDTATLPFPLLLMLCYQHYQSCSSRGKKALFLIAMSVLLFMGYALKGSIAVMLVALVIVLLLDAKQGARFRAGLNALLVMALFVLQLFAYNSFYDNSGIIDQSHKQANELPTTLWLVFGSHDTAIWDLQDYNAILALPDLQARKDAAAQMLRENYASYTPSELFSFLRWKHNEMWGDGRYGADIFTVNAYASSWTHYFILPDSYYFPYFDLYCDSFHLMTLLMFLASLLAAFRRPDDSVFLFGALSLFGLILFLTVWEMNPRYLFNFTPILLLGTTRSLCSLAGRFAPSKSLSGKKLSSVSDKTTC